MPGIGSGGLDVKMGNSEQTVEATAGGVPNAQDGKLLRVLLVSDDAWCVDAVATLDWRAQVQPVSTAGGLTQALASATWDVMVLDLRLRAMPPAEALRMGYAGLPVVMLCDEGDGWEEVVGALLRAGATTFLPRTQWPRLTKVCKRVVSKTLGTAALLQGELLPAPDAAGILTALLREATDSIVVKDRDGRYLLINPAGAEFLGRSAQDVIGKTDFDLFTLETAQRIVDSDREVMCHEKTQIIEDLLIPLAGETRIFQAMKCVYRSTQGQVQGIINVVRDITLRRQAEDALKESEQRFRMMADAAPVMIWMTDECGKPNYFNKQWLDFTGQGLEEAQSENWSEPIHPEDWQVVRAECREPFLARQSLKVEFRLRYQAECKYYWVLAEGTPRFNVDGSFAGYIGSCVSIHEQKMAQKELAEYAVKLQQSNEDLEQFATVASHDLQAPLRKVMMFSDAIQQTTSNALSEEGRDYLERMQRAARKMQELITDLLDLSRITRKAQPFQPVHLERVAREVLADLLGNASNVDGDGSLVTLEGLDIWLDAEPVQMGQLLQNLVENALKFRRADVPVQVRISAQRQDDRCIVQVADNGIGFDEKYTQRIFGVFERLHGAATYEGSGMGLAICKKIVAYHNGEITATSVPQVGSTFTVSLPIHQLFPA